MRKQKENGSVTLEACIVVPVFIMLMLLICGMFVMFMGQQIITHAVIQSAKSLAFDPYATERGAANSETELTELFGDIFESSGGYNSNKKWYSSDSAKLNGVVSDRVRAYLIKNGGGWGAAYKLDKKLDALGVYNGANGLSVSGSKVEDGVLTVTVGYKQKFPLDAFGLTGFDRSITVKVRLFTWAKLPNSVYEVSFNSNGGSVVSNKITDQSNGSLPVPSKDGYDFVGWTTDPNSKTPDVKNVDDAKKVGENGDGSDTLYAIWEPKKHASYRTDGNLRLDWLHSARVWVEPLSDVLKLEELKKAGYTYVTITFQTPYDSDDQQYLNTTLTIDDETYNTDHQWFGGESKVVTHSINVPIDQLIGKNKVQMSYDVEDVDWDIFSSGTIGSVAIDFTAKK